MAEEPAPAEPVVVVVTTPGGDDSSYQIPLTTTVTFDGVQYSNVYATTNSVITFGKPDGTYWTYPQTPSISLYSMDWVVYPNQRSDEHLIIRASDGGFQVDISARPIWLQNATEPTNINIVAAINIDGTVAISYSLTGPTYEGQTRTGVRLTNGQIATLEEYGVVQVETPPVLTPEPVTPTPEPTPIQTPTPEPTPQPTVEPTPEPVVTPEPTPQPTTPTPFIPEGATLLGEGSSIEVIAPAGQRIVSVTAWYGDPADGSRGIEVSSQLTQLASGQTSVTIDSDNRYGDPAGGTVKVLIFVVNYEPIPTPEPTPVIPPIVIPEPTPTPTLDPVVDPTPTPTPQPEPTLPLAPSPSPEPQPEPTPEPTPTPQPPVEPTPEPTVPAEPEPPVVVPEPPVVEPTPEPPVVIPEPAPEPTPVEPEPPVVKEEEITSAEQLPEIISAELLTKIDLTEIVATDLTPQQAEALKEAALQTFETAEKGSAEYEQALDALYVAAAADDIVLSPELAAIPGAEALVDAINFLGNAGADMSPETRKTAEETVVAAVVAGNAAIAAAAGAAGAASSAAASSGGGGGASGGSRKESTNSSRKNK
jgi:hypothetical protein